MRALAGPGLSGAEAAAAAHADLLHCPVLTLVWLGARLVKGPFFLRASRASRASGAEAAAAYAEHLHCPMLPSGLVVRAVVDHAAVGGPSSGSEPVVLLAWRQRHLMVQQLQGATGLLCGLRVLELLACCQWHWGCRGSLQGH